MQAAAATRVVSNCYARGTHILTLAGEVAVEALQVGDRVVTFADSLVSLKPISWLGRRRVDLWRHPDPDAIRPIRIRAGALGQGRPHRDLVVSPGHHVRIDNSLVAALELVNGASIVQENPDETEYWHVELDEHDLILAEGAQAETYQDFAKSAASLDGDTPKPCLPYAEVSPDMRARLIAQAEALGWPQTLDAEPWLEADGQRIEPTRQDVRWRFNLPAGCQTLRLRSRAVRPWDVDAQSTDKRLLGLKLHRLALDGPGGVREVALTSSALRDGFHAVESEPDGWNWRWTTGDALLDLANLAAGEPVTALEIDFDQALAMWVEPETHLSQTRGAGQTFLDAEVWALAG